MSDEEKNSIEDRATRAFGNVATTVERVGIPVATFSLGAVVLAISGRFGVMIPQLPWLGTALVVASLLTYIWLTARSTLEVKAPPPPIQDELKEQLAWMREEISKQNEWLRKTNKIGSSAEFVAS